MMAKYSIDQTTKTLLFTGNPQSLKKNSVKNQDKKEIKLLVIPNSVSTIEERTFQHCFCVVSVNIPNSVSAIEKYAFNYCTSLAFVYIPSSVSSVGWCAFRYCHKIASVYIPNSVAIATAAFYDCLRLHKAYVPANSKINAGYWRPSFGPLTAILRPRLNPISVLQKKSACRASKATYSIFL